MTIAFQKVDSSTAALMWSASGITQNDWLGQNRWVETSDMQSDGAGGVIALVCSLQRGQLQHQQ